MEYKNLERLVEILGKVPVENWEPIYDKSDNGPTEPIGFYTKLKELRFDLRFRRDENTTYAEGGVLVGEGEHAEVVDFPYTDVQTYATLDVVDPSTSLTIEQECRPLKILTDFYNSVNRRKEEIERETKQREAQAKLERGKGKLDKLLE